MDSPNQPEPSEQHLPRPTRGTVPPVMRIASRDLLGPGGELVITHDGRDYRLRITQNGKLLLTA